MGKCKYFEICGLEDDADPKENLCILHARHYKEKEEFKLAFEAHRKKQGDNFSYFVFPEEINFEGKKFQEEVNFYSATFSQTARFSNAIFFKRADFSKTTFTKKAFFNWVNFVEHASFGQTDFTGEAYFLGATFSQGVDFLGAKFTDNALFLDVTFNNTANFSNANFAQIVDFSRAIFSEGTDFEGTDFRTGCVKFLSSTFKGRSLFTSKKESDLMFPIFSAVQEVDFRSVSIDPPDSVTFIEADLRKCLFLKTNLQKVNFFGVDWPYIKKGRFGVYDEKKIGEEKREDRPIFLAHVESLYRQLKKNYEDNRDYERAGHFHYGEKEMRRKNTKTTFGLKFLLILYKWLSGYGESFLHPLFWIGILLCLSMIAYLSFGISPKGGPRLIFKNPGDWLQALHYSFRVMTLLRPDDLTPIGGGKVIHTIQSILGPLFIALLALAVRQKLKR